MQTLTIIADENALSEIKAFIKAKNLNAKFDDIIKQELEADIKAYKKGELNTASLATKWKYL